MKTVPALLLAVALAAFLALPLATAQDSPPPPEKKPAAKPEEPKEPAGPEMDELSKSLYDAFHKKAYSLADAGVKKASFTLKFKLTGGQMPIDVTADYKWDGEKGTLVWSDPAVGGFLAGQGMNVDQFNALFKSQKDMANLTGAKLTATRHEDGTATVKFERHPKMKSITFNAEGLVSSMTLTVSTQLGEKELVRDVTWRKIGETWVESGYTAKLDFGELGTFEETGETTVEEVNGFLVQVKTVGKGKLGELMSTEKVTEFTNWKFNDDVK